MNKEKKLPSVSINWYPGHMVKTKKQIIEDLKLIDVVVEILDARIPISSRNPDIQQIAKDKKKIIVLNKSDLADEKESKKWITYFESQGIKAVITDSNSGYGINDVTREIQNIVKEENEKFASKGRVGKTIRVMVVGIPNVGKSSFINRITKKTSAGVGNKPGYTKQKQWIRVENGIELMDTPGVLWPKFESEEVALNLSFVGTIKDENIDKVEVAFYLLKFLLENYSDNVIDRYKITEEELNGEVIDVFNLIGKKRGAIISGGNIDEERTANLLIDDFRTGKLGKLTFEKAN